MNTLYELGLTPASVIHVKVDGQIATNVLLKCEIFSVLDESRPNNSTPPLKSDFAPTARSKPSSSKPKWLKLSK